MKALYFNVFICKNGEKTDYPISNLIDHINNKQAKDRTKEVDGKFIFLSRHRFPEMKRKDNGMAMDGYEYEVGNRTVWIGKFLEDKPFAGEIGSEQLEEISGDVYQPNTCLFICEAHLLLMEFTNLGPKKNALEGYLSQFLEGDEYTVKLVPKKKKKMLSLVKASESIKEIVITVKNDDFSLNSVFKDYGEHKTLLEKAVESPVNAGKEMGANETTIVFKKGRMRKNMSSDMVSKILEMINIKSDYLVSAKVTFLNPKTQEKETINLKLDGLYNTDLGEIKSNGFDFLANKFTEHYYDYHNRNKNPEYRKFLPLKNISIDEIKLK